MPSPASVRLLIVDDSPAIRRGVRGLLSKFPEWEICGEASNGKEAVDQCISMHPDVVIMDIVMPEMNGFEAAAAIHQLAPSVRVVFLSMYELPYLRRIFEKTPPKGDEYVSKNGATDQLPIAIRHVLESGN